MDTTSGKGKRGPRRPMGSALKEQIRELTPDECWVLFDERARRYLGIGGAEFIRRWEAGDYRAEVESRDVRRVVAALPFAHTKAQSQAP